MQTLEFPGRERLEVEGNAVRIVGPGGDLLLTVLLTPSGPVLRFEGARLSLETSGDLALNARHVSIHGREGVRISSEGDFESRARIQDITATLGNVNLRANDDVKLDGERILLNC